MLEQNLRMAMTANSGRVSAAHQALQEEINKLNKVQRQYQKLITINGQLDTQKNENMMVQEELSLTNPNSRVFKLTGKVMVPQSLTDAKTNVERRMKFIEEEQKRNNDQIEQVRKEVQECRGKVSQLDNQLKAVLKETEKKLEEPKEEVTEKS